MESVLTSILPFSPVRMAVAIYAEGQLVFAASDCLLTMITPLDSFEDSYVPHAIDSLDTSEMTLTPQPGSEVISNGHQHFIPSDTAWLQSNLFET
jgi:hypothetical protein